MSSSGASLMTAGWELLYHIERENIKSKQDVIVLMIHHILIKHGFRCIHEEDSESKPTKLSELLPSGWNSSDNNSGHSIAYYHDGSKYRFTATFTDGILTSNLLDIKNQLVQSFAVSPESEVKSLSGSLADMVPNYKELFCKIWSDILGPTSKPEDPGISLREEIRQQRTEPDPTNQGQSNLPPLGTNIFPNRFDPVGVGYRDLNPLAPPGPGGGMLLEGPRGWVPTPGRDLPGSGMLPRGSIPPGARFDPMHPFVPSRRAGPDPDHLPMPGNFSDSMFM